MELAIQRMLIVSLFVVGVSHIIAPRAWAKFFIELREKGESGSIINAFIHFPVGALIIGFHNVWHGVPIIITLLGWGWAIKGFIYFTFPKVGLRSMSRVSMERASQFAIAGVIIVIVASVLLVDLLWWSAG